MKNTLAVLCMLLINGFFSEVFAQKNKQAIKQEQCATMVRLEEKFKRNPNLKSQFFHQLDVFNRSVADRVARQKEHNVTGVEKPTAVYTIPIVFHIVMSNPAQVTDAQILSQLDVLNKTYSATNADISNVPDYFKPLIGQASVQFCLAQRTPSGDITNGIDRVATRKTSFSNSDDGVKHTSSGGVDIWNGDKYYNVWVCVLSNNLLGYGTFPNDGAPLEQGVVIDYHSLPGGSYANYNSGKTLTHETGHYFNLFHIWGDDNGACTGSDFVDDTPNQGDASTACFTGIKLDSCTKTGNGIMYQNFMDYSFDQCLLLFTKLQAVRMQTALLTYRSSLTTSDGCTPVVLKTLDAQLKTIDAPVQRICTSSFTPQVTIRNKGTQTLTSLTIETVIDNSAPVINNWTGSLVSLATSAVTLKPVTIASGTHQIKIFVTAPNAGTDQFTGNDTLTNIVQYADAVASVSESFEGSVFPPAGWDVVNPDQSITWEKVTGVAKTGNASVGINNFDYTNTDEQDYLRLPELNFATVDSAFLTFQVAASTYTPVSTAGNNWDTLEVLISKDCGLTYTSLYKKWGATLVTTASETTESFRPVANEWRRDSINLTPYVNDGKVLLAFRNTNGFENNIYLDDINVRTITINPNLKAAGFLVTPNPAKSNIAVQFYPNPADLKSIQLFNLFGQKLYQANISGAGASLYNVDVARYPAGTYIVRVILGDRVLVKKIIKQ
ncbi:M43 family zinc metalloprotease [Ferruginibacter paludis]|uniref:M43 family zinc metalloprotease n=1 Tax=Ferruginibacter paludis TaxID=1310417 RepID=UPI0025B4F32E|nr:M43 family zinc metalloprotease [Ferruginibacter paludis]MDN3654954.1 M43 family zinc metalloprotease [Ferruginibacter paludis]